VLKKFDSLIESIRPCIVQRATLTVVRPDDADGDSQLNTPHVQWEARICS
jgi:hypothetical protein